MIDGWTDEWMDREMNRWMENNNNVLLTVYQCTGAECHANFGLSVIPLKRIIVCVLLFTYILDPVLISEVPHCKQYHCVPDEASWITQMFDQIFLKSSCSDSQLMFYFIETQHI